MIKSMTGFGRCEASDENRKISVELKSVNHRYFDMNIKMPKKLLFLEASVRALLKAYIQRGKVDLFISYEDLSEKTATVHYHSGVAAEYLKFLRRMAQEFQIEDDVRTSTLSRYPEVFTLEEQTIDEEGLWILLKKALDSACRQFVQSRADEGASLKADLTAKLKQMEAYVDQVEERAPQILKQYKARLEEKIREVLCDTQIEESRLSTELVLFADKICTDEETVRLRSHIRSMLDAIDRENDEGIGRKLDFIAQEMNREANTILSKANDLETSNIAIELKTCIEKVREQIQNVE